MSTRAELNAAAANNMFFLGLNQPVATWPANYEIFGAQGTIWRDTRQLVQQKLATHASDRLFSTIESNSHQWSASLKDILSTVANLEAEWQKLSGYLFSQNCSRVQLSAAAAEAKNIVAFYWRTIEPIVVGVTGKGVMLNSFKRQTPHDFRSTSIAFETVALKLLKTSLLLQLSVAEMLNYDYHRAAECAHLAIVEATDTAQNCVPLHFVLPAPAEQIRRQPFFLSPFFWRNWLAAMLIAQKNWADSFVTLGTTCFAARCSSGSLLGNAVVNDSPLLLVDNEMQETFAQTGDTRQCQTLIGLAALIAPAARAQHNQSHLVIVVRLLRQALGEKDKVDAKTIERGTQELQLTEAVLKVVNGSVLHQLQTNRFHEKITLVVCHGSLWQLDQGTLTVPWQQDE